MSEDDEELWAYVTRDVEPLAPSRKGKMAAHKPEKPDSAKPAPLATDREPVKQRASAPAGSDKPVGIDRNTAERLRKGQIPIDARLDLHGMNQAQAYEALGRCIQGAYASHKRCILVITGKGVGASGRRDPLESGQGVLKRQVPHWLAEDHLRPMVLKTVPARPKDGGEGALYVLLRRNR